MVGVRSWPVGTFGVIPLETEGWSEDILRELAKEENDRFLASNCQFWYFIVASTSICTVQRSPFVGDDFVWIVCLLLVVKNDAFFFVSGSAQVSQVMCCAVQGREESAKDTYTTRYWGH